MEAINRSVELTALEQLYLRWLCRCGDRETIDVFVGLFNKIRVDEQRKTLEVL